MHHSSHSSLIASSPHRMVASSTHRHSFTCSTRKHACARMSYVRVVCAHVSMSMLQCAAVCASTFCIMRHASCGCVCIVHHVVFGNMIYAYAAGARPHNSRMLLHPSPDENRAGSFRTNSAWPIPRTAMPSWTKLEKVVEGLRMLQEFQGNPKNSYENRRNSKEIKGYHWNS